MRSESSSRTLVFVDFDFTSLPCFFVVDVQIQESAQSVSDTEAAFAFA